MTAAKTSKIANLREHIMASSHLPEERVHVAEWDKVEMECWILVRSLTAKERAQFMRRLLAQQPGQPAQTPGQPVSINWERYAVDIVLMTARDPDDGALLFRPTDRDALLEMPAKPIETLASAARRLSGMEDGAQSDARFPDSED